MRTETSQPIHLADYAPPDFLVDTIALVFRLEPERTRVAATLRLRRSGEHDRPLRLDGDGLRTVSVRIDGETADHDASDDQLVVRTSAEAFTLETEVEIDPSANSALMGLYMSGGRFCTQCEAEGFRRITWFLDRPDVLARYTVRIEADRRYPRLLSNGNLIQSGELPEGRHFAVWEDPFPKPCYLFALVAGELDMLEGEFTTMSGRSVRLQVFVDPGMAPRAEYALDSLKRAMKWDEDAYGREYDLDLFMIVAVRDFNFGAMENKGLNIFNSSLLLADAETATDLDYERIEGVVAHEYFHNWTGNRITCRDWFQLCLKEGFTVFRDHGFSAAMRGEAVQRIKEVQVLRARQFAEDASPMAHPVRPSSFVKIENFYTATIYEKGSELIRMLKMIVGDAAFRAGSDLYFERWDGQATTVEAFIACFAEASGRDLAPFFRWYEQAGTPNVTLDAVWDKAASALDITLRQSTAATPGQAVKAPAPIPIAWGLLDEDGRVMRETEVFVLEEAEQRLRIEGITSEPVVSALRGFSAPVTLTYDEPRKDAYVRLAADDDLFNRWEAGQALARSLILSRAKGAPDEVGEERFAEALGRALTDQSASDAFKALLLDLPSEGDLSLAMSPADPRALHEAREALRLRLAIHLKSRLRDLHGALQEAGSFSASAEAAGRRALRNAALNLLVADPSSDAEHRARGHYEAAANMTDAIGGLSALIKIGGEAAEEALADFHKRWKTEPLVIDKWFALQARDPCDGALGRVLGLTVHPDFDGRTPNRLRALIGGFAVGNPARFHDPSGAGYRFLADQILMVDAFNPQLAAGLVAPLASWGRYTPELAALMRAELDRIAAAPSLSENTRELVEKACG